MPLRGRRNVAEAAFEQLAAKSGWQASKRGWPDYTCWRDDELIAVEVKPRTAGGRMKYLRPDQVRIMDMLTAHGIRCYVSDGETLEPYDRTIHADKAMRYRSRASSPRKRSTPDAYKHRTRAPASQP